VTAPNDLASRKRDLHCPASDVARNFLELQKTAERGAGLMEGGYHQRCYSPFSDTTR